MKRAFNKIAFINVGIAVLCVSSAFCVSISQCAHYPGCGCVALHDVARADVKMCGQLFPCDDRPETLEFSLDPQPKNTEILTKFPNFQPEYGNKSAWLALVMTSHHNFRADSLRAELYDMDDGSAQIDAPPSVLLMIGVSILAFMGFMFERVISGRKLASRW